MTKRIKIEDLMWACNQSRACMAKPFRVGGDIVATDGKVLVRMSAESVVVEDESEQLLGSDANPPDISRLWDVKGVDNVVCDLEIEAVDCLVHAVKIPCKACDGTGKCHRCPECDGKGEIEFSTDYNEYSVECETCDGEGIIKTDNVWGRKGEISLDCESCGGRGFNEKFEPCLFRFGTFLFSAEYISKLAKMCGSCRYAEAGWLGVFRFDGGVALIAKMRSEG